MAFSLDQYINGKKKQTGRLGAAGTVKPASPAPTPIAFDSGLSETDALRAEVRYRSNPSAKLPTAVKTTTPTGKTASGGSGFSLDGYILEKGIRSGTLQEQDNDFNSWLSDLQSFSQRMTSDYTKRQSAYQAPETFRAYRDKTGAEISELLKRAYTARNYYTQYGKTYDEVYGEGSTAKLLEGISQNIDYLEGVRKNLHSEGDWWEQFQDQAAFDTYQRHKGYVEIPQADKTIGQYGRGNIDLYKRPQYKTSDGKIATVESMSFNEDGKEILVPTIAFDTHGAPIKLTDDQAIKRYHETGEYLGKFDTVDEADAYAELLHQAQDFYYNSRYKSTYQPGTEKFNAFSGTYSNTGFGDISYDYINRDKTAMDRQLLSDIQSNAALLGLDNSERGEMTDEEIAVFNYLYATRSPEEAYQYIADLTAELNFRQRQSAEAEWAKYADEHPVGSSVFSILESPMKGLSYLGQFADYTADGKIDQNEGYNKFSYINSAIRGEVSKKIEESGNWGQAGSFLYQTGMSMGDFLLNTAITGGNQALTLSIMGTGAAADATIAAKDRGLSDDQAFALGTIAGLAEVVTEKISLEALLKPNWEKGVLNYIIKNAVAEGSEEVASDAINLVADVLISKDKSEWSQSIQAYMAQGYSEGEATGLAVRDQAMSMGLDFLGGALSGGVMSGVAGAGHVLTNYESGRQFNAMDLSTEDIRAFIDEGLASDPDTQAYRLAVAAQQKLAAGGTLTNYELGNLYQANVRAIGVEDEGVALLQQAAQDAADGKRITNRVAQSIVDSPSALRTLAEEIGLSLSEDMSRSQRREAVRTALNDLARPAVDVTATRETSTTPVTQQGEIGAEIRQEEQTAQVRPTAPVQQVWSNRRLDTALETLGPQGKVQGKAFFDSATQDPAIYYGGWAAYYEAGVNGMDMGKVQAQYASALNSAQKQAAYLAGQADAAASLRAEQERIPTATVYGDQAGFIQNDQAVKLPRSTVIYYNNLARAAGVKIQMAPATGSGGANGWYANGIINIAEDAEDPGIVVATHEVTHRMQEMAPKEYRAYRDYAMQALGAKGGTHALVEAYKARYAQAGQNLTTEQAMDEIAADFTEDLLRNVEGFKDLANTHRSVARKLLDAVRDFIRKVKAVFEGNKAQQDSAAAQAYGVDMDTLEEAARLWGEALKATSAAAKAHGSIVGTEGGYATVEGKFSLKKDSAGRDLTKEQAEFFEDSKAVDDQGRLMVVYHGTVSDFTIFDRSFSNPESDMGSGFYFTNNIDDVEANYANEDGPDLQQKIQLMADRLESNEDMDSDEALEIARKHYIRSAPHTIEAYLKIENPVILGGEQATIFDMMEEYDEETDEYGEPTGLLPEFIQAVSDELAEGDYSESDADFGPLWEMAYDGGFTAEQLVATFKENILPYVEDGDGNIVNSEVIRRAFERMGFDGIIDHTVSSKFGASSGRKNHMVGVEDDTTHYIIFNSAQAKNVTNKKPTDAPDIRYSVKKDSAGRSLTKAQRDYFAESKARDEQGRLLVLYHGTTAYGEITKFRHGRTGWLGPGIYLASMQSEAQHYADKMGPGGGQVYALYANITNPLMVTSGNPVPEILRAAYGRDGVYEARKKKQGNDTYIITPADIKKLQAKGYDGIMWTFGKNTEVSAFYPEQLKRVDNKAPTQDRDIRYSLKTDSEGRELSKEQREFFKDSKAVDGQGRLKVMYHGSNAAFTVFDRARLTDRLGFFFTESKEEASGYGKPGEFYLNVTNPFDVFGDTELADFLGDAPKYVNGEFNVEAAVTGLVEAGYDGIYSFSHGVEWYIAFSPEQIKNVDNKKPTSDPDIRFSLKGTRTIQEDIKALNKENEILRERLDYWKGQTKRTKRITTDKKAVAKAAKAIIQYAGSTLNTEDIRADLQSLYDFIASGYDGKEELTGDGVWERAHAIARRLASTAWAVDDDLYQEYAELRAYLRETSLNIGKEFNDIADFGDFRKRYFGKLRIGTKGTNIDQVYGELSAMWPGFFDEQKHSHPSDQLLHIAEVADALYDVSEYNPYSADMERATAGIANEIIEQFFDLPQTKATMADKWAAKVEAAKQKGRSDVRKVRDQMNERVNAAKQAGKAAVQQQRLADEMFYGRKLAELREQNQERVKRALQRQRETTTRQMEAMKDRYAAKDQKGRERRSAAELRRKITRHSKALSDKLLHPTDKGHIPQELRGAVAAMLEAINQESAYTVDREGGKRTKNGTGDPTKRTEAFRALREQYEAISEGRTDFTGVLDPDLLDNLSAVIAMKDVRLADMTTAQLATVWQVVRAVEQSVSTANKLLGKSRFGGVKELAEGIRSSSASRRTKGNWKGVVGWGDRLLNLDMMNPLTFFHQFGEGGDALYHELQTARDNKTRILAETVDQVQRVIGKADINALRQETHTFHVEGGDITLTTAQIMSLYELAKREQAQDHIYKGGLRASPIDTGVDKGKSAAENVAAALGRVDAPAAGVRVSQGDVATILSTLTEEQVKIADGLQAIMQGYLAQEGNRESMKVYGYEKFTEDHYFPIASDPHQVQDKIGDVLESGAKRPRSVAEWGSAKATVTKANNGLLLGDIFDVFAQHAVDMATYASHLGAMEDLNRVRNFTFRDGEGNRTGTMGDIIQRVTGQGGGAYINKLLQDVSAGTAKSNVTGLGKLTANYKAASVGANIRVALQQPTSYLRAAAVIDAKYLADPRVFKKGGWAKALKYAPIAQWKDWGNFEINQGRQLQNIMFNTDSKLEKARNAAMWLAGEMDSVTWGRIWNACELETMDTHPGLARGSEAFYEAVAQRFTDIIDQTQVVDNVLGRSQIMRSSDGLAKMATSYMGEPTQSYNLVYRAVRDLAQEQDSAKRTAARKTLGRAVVALTASQFVNAIAQALWDAVRDDDDRDKKYLERVLGHIPGNFVDNVNPVGMVPYAKDILSMLQGYDVKRMDMEAITSFISACQNMGKAINGEGRYTLAGAGANLLAETARIFGLPAATVKRDMVALARTVGVETGDWYFQYQLEKALNSVGYSGNRGEFYDIAWGALKDGEVDIYQIITQDLMAQGVKAATIESAMRDRLKKAKEEDPDFTLGQRERDLIGSRDAYATPEAKEDTGGFTAADLSPSEYQGYNAQRAESYREVVDTLEGFPTFRGLDATVKDKALAAADKLTEALALEDHSGGAYTADTKWMQWATGGADAGVDEAEAILFKVAYDMAQSDVDPKTGKAISGSKKENVLEAVEEMMPWLTDEELEYLIGNYWKG